MTTFTRRLAAASPLLHDHRIGGAPVAPAAAQVDLMLSACHAAGPERQWQLGQVAFVTPLRVPGPEVEIEVELAEDGACSLSARQPDGTLAVHSRARAQAARPAPPQHRDLAQLRAGCPDELPLSAVTTWRQGSGIEYGPSYHTIRAASQGPDRMVALLRMAADSAEPHVVPPPLLDGVLQCLGILDAGRAGPCLPWFVGRIDVHRPVTGTVWALIEHLGGGTGGLARGRATVVSQQGEVLLELDRIAMKQLPRPARSAEPSPALAAEHPAASAAAAAVPAAAVAAPAAAVAGPAVGPVAPAPMTAPAWRAAVAAPAQPERSVLRLTPADLRPDRLDTLLAGGKPDEVVYVAAAGQAGPVAPLGAAAATAALQQAFALVRALAARPPMPDLSILTGTAHPVTGRESIDPVQTALWGLARTLRTEHPRTRIRLLDLGTSADPELERVDAAELELAWRDGRWYAPDQVACPAGGSAPAIEGGRFLVTGGMGGIGLHVAEFLAQAGCAHLTLVGRTVPDRGERRQRLDRLAAACDLTVLRADVSSLGEALRGAPRFDGVIHAAGVLRDGLARSLAPHQIEEVFAPKIGGVHALDAAFGRSARPGFVALFSSISAVHGNLGQSSYATANAYLDGYAARRRAEGESWYSLNWGLWAVGMGEAFVAAAAARGMPALSVDEGLGLLRAALAQPPGNYLLCADPAGPAAAEPTTTATGSTAKDSQMAQVTSESSVWSLLSAAVRKTLHVPTVSQDDNLLELGLDSMMAVELAAALAANGWEVDPIVFFENGNVDVLLKHLEGLGAPAAAAALAPSPAPATVAAIWDQYRQVDGAAAAVQQPTVPQSPVLAAPASQPAAAPAPPLARPPVATGRPAPAWPVTAGPNPLIPGRTLPGRLQPLPGGTAFDRLLDALSAEERSWVAEGDYPYEPVIEETDGAWIKFDGRWFRNLSSYSYLGLIGHDYINEQAQRAVRRHGTGAQGVRMLAGTLHLHRELELTIARYLGTEDAIVFSSGYMANMATLGALVEPDDVILGDVYNHASILDGFRLSGAKVLTYAHNDMSDLERALRKAGEARKLVVADAVFSMDGDIADLPGIVELCQRYDAPLMIDEAHSLGVLGATGRGITEHFGIDPARVQIKMGTLSKTVPSAGGYVAGSSDLIFALKNNARGWVFSAAVPPAQVAAAKAAFEVMTAVPALTATLRARTDRYRSALQQLGFNTLASQTAVVPIICDRTDTALAMARICQRDGLFVQPIVYPAVPRSLPRLRTIVNLDLSDGDLDDAVTTLEKAGREVGLIT